jgi:hypothetical protein
MKTIDQGTTKEMFNLSDELYETVQLKLQDRAFEVVQTTHDELIQFVVSEYRVDPDKSMTNWGFKSSDIVKSCVFSDEVEAKAFLLRIVMSANLKA